jgi:hypothetical protein
MTVPLSASFQAAFVGRPCSIARAEFIWTFDFGNGATIISEGWWRLIADGHLAFASEDDGQQFGLPAPLDGEKHVNDLLHRHAVISLTISSETADLVVTFEGATRLEILGSSLGYESWQAHCVADGQKIQIIGGGAGQLSFVSTPISDDPRIVFGQALPVSWIKS